MPKGISMLKGIASMTEWSGMPNALPIHSNGAMAIKGLIKKFRKK